MKKLLALLLAVLLAVSLCACGDKKEEQTTNPGGDEIVEDRVVDAAGDSFYFESIDSETVRIVNFAGPSAPHAVNVPETIKGKTVTEIGEGAFRAASNITVVTLPATMEAIGEYAFAESSVTAIRFPASFKTLGKAAFYGCSALTEVTFAEGILLSEIPYAAFINGGLTSIELPASIKLVGDAAFMNNKALASVKINEGTELVGNAAFQGCLALATLQLPASLAEIGEYAFSGSENLYMTGVTVPAGSAAEAYVAEMKLAAAAPEVPAVPAA